MRPSKATQLDFGCHIVLFRINLQGVRFVLLPLRLCIVVVVVVVVGKETEEEVEKKKETSVESIEEDTVNSIGERI